MNILAVQGTLKSLLHHYSSKPLILWHSAFFIKNVHYCTIAFISHACKEMLKILQVRLQQYRNQELPDVQAGFRKGRGTRDQIAKICWIMQKA